MLDPLLPQEVVEVADIPPADIPAVELIAPVAPAVEAAALLPVVVLQSTPAIWVELFIIL